MLFLVLRHHNFSNIQSSTLTELTPKLDRMPGIVKLSGSARKERGLKSTPASQEWELVLNTYESFIVNGKRNTSRMAIDRTKVPAIRNHIAMRLLDEDEFLNVREATFR